VNSFQEFELMIENNEAGKQIAERDAKLLQNKITENEVAYVRAVMDSKSTLKITKDIEGLKKELQVVERMDLSLGEKSLSKCINAVQAKAQEIVSDNIKIIAECQKEFSSKALELQELKKQFLEKVAEMGTINKKADWIAYENRIATKHIPGKESIWYQGIVTEIQEKNCTGSIFLQDIESLRAFKK
jgi:hypothetical protein